jgi:outer membrane protein
MKRIFLISFSLLLSMVGFSQHTYSLKEAIDYSLSNHRSTKIYNNEIDRVKFQTSEALAGYLPQISGKITYDDNIKRQTTVLPGAMLGQQKDIAVQFGNKYNSGASIQLDQTIYDQSLIYGIKAGEPAKKRAELNLAKNNEDLIYNTAVAYSQIMVLKEQQRLIAANAKENEELYKILQFRFEKGVAKKVDVDRELVLVNNSKAQLEQIQTDIESATNALKNAMGLPLESSLLINDTLNHDKYLMLVRFDDVVNAGIDHQIELQNISLQEIDIKRKKAAYLPTISAYARYGGQAFGNDINKAVTNWNNYSGIGLQMNVPIFSGLRRESQLKQSKIELENRKENLQLIDANIQLQVKNSYKQLRSNITTLTMNKANMELAKTVYETTQFEYSKGVTTMSDLLNAEYSYRQSQTNYLTSLINLITNRLEYEKSKGTITTFINQL